MHENQKLMQSKSIIAQNLIWMQNKPVFVFYRQDTSENPNDSFVDWLKVK